MNRVSSVCCSCVMVLIVLAGLMVPSTCPAGDEKGPALKATQSELNLIAGKWLRPDGGYILELSNVKPDGKMKAAYFNPRPIHVAKAEWRSMGDRIQIFVELRDRNYPGSTYTLIYSPEYDSLGGYYYQAAIGQTFDVVFTRAE